MTIQTKNTRKHGKHIRVPVLPEEEALIKRNADAAGLSTAAFLRKVGMGYEVESMVDIEQVKELSRVNGDLGRLGGLLKLWLSNDERTRNFSPALINTLLGKIDATQSALRDVMDRILSK
ncbi:conjugal transfer transcriptional regulator TraJ [Salmonella enterica]|uniref:conjugal transfer transcriptional regulator TraJ n=1 Tax=Klebsiella pneumoniae TaxID=573 RepID=UPI0027F8273E|nr:conjugal transfer transcriptional regulator TraJ [Salmonella enterica]EKY8230913.1 conjugal transfer transcriptional regulator TraJ [Salmonella enterica]